MIRAQRSGGVRIDVDLEGKTVVDDEFRCPICMEIYWSPRMYLCGHTVCSHCMRETDQLSCESSPTFHTPVYKCPICRETTITPWTDRPLNRALMTLIKKYHSSTVTDREKSISEHVKAAMKDASEEDANTEKLKKLNLAKVSLDFKTLLAKKTYTQLIKLLYESAKRGETIFIINEKNILQDIERCIEQLAPMLYQNNIYRIVVTHEECSIYLTKGSLKWKREWVNREHQHEGEEKTGEVESDEEERASREVTRITGNLRNLVRRRMAAVSLAPLSPPPPPGMRSRR